jgi:hypothetical protein
VSTVLLNRTLCLLPSPNSCSSDPNPRLLTAMHARIWVLNARSLTSSTHAWHHYPSSFLPPTNKSRKFLMHVC